MKNENKTAGIAHRSKASAKPSTKHQASTQIELAALLGLSRWTIARGLKREGNPGTRPDGRFDVAAWRNFFAELHEPQDEATVAEKQRNMRLKNDKLEAQIAIMRREWAPMVDVEKWGAELGSAIRVIVNTLHLSAPTLAGIPIPEIEARLKQIEGDILEQLRTIDDQNARWREAPRP